MAWNRCTGAVIFLMPVKGGRTIWHPDNLAPENLASDNLAPENLAPGQFGIKQCGTGQFGTKVVKTDNFAPRRQPDNLALR